MHGYTATTPDIWTILNSFSDLKKKTINDEMYYYFDTLLSDLQVNKVNCHVQKINVGLILHVLPIKVRQLKMDNLYWEI